MGSDPLTLLRMTTDFFETAAGQLRETFMTGRVWPLCGGGGGGTSSVRMTGYGGKPVSIDANETHTRWSAVSMAPCTTKPLLVPLESQGVTMAVASTSTQTGLIIGGCRGDRDIADEASLRDATPPGCGDRPGFGLGTDRELPRGDASAGAVAGRCVRQDVKPQYGALQVGRCRTGRCGTHPEFHEWLLRMSRIPADVHSQRIGGTGRIGGELIDIGILLGR